jgi:uncharacterized membrane protein YdjX (TVP38/TMEM64 family)
VKRYALLTGLMMAGFLALFGVAAALDLPLLADPGPWLAERGWIAALAGVGLLVADVLLPVPSSLVMIANGALFGVAAGTALSLAGSMGAALAGFLLGRRGSALVARFVPEDERRRAGALLQRWGDLAIVVSRPVPILAETVAVLAGTSPLGWGRMTAAALAGSLPAALIYAATGAAAATLGDTAAVFALVLLVAGVFWLVGRWLR